MIWWPHYHDSAMISLLKWLRPIAVNVTQCILGKALLKACSFVTLPLLTFYITREEMGVYQLLYGGMGIFAEIVTLGTRQYFGIQFFKYQTLFPRLILIAKNLWIYLRITSLLFLLLFLAMEWKRPDGYRLICFFVIAQSYLHIFNDFYLTTLRYRMKFLSFNIISSCFGLLQVAAVITSVVVLKQHLLGLVIGLLLVESVQLLYSVIASNKAIHLMRKIRVKNQLSSVIPLIKNSLIFIPSTLSFWLLMNIDQWMLGGIEGLDSVGLYAFAGKFPLFFDYFLTSSFLSVYTPFVYKKLQENFFKISWNNMLLALAIMILSIIVYLIANHSTFLFKPILAENYHAGLKFIPPLIFVACLRFAISILQIPIRFKNSTVFIVWSTLIAAGINGLLNFFWIPKYGIDGCVMATVISFLLMFLMNLSLYVVLTRKKTAAAW